MAKDKVLYNGMLVLPEWPARVEAAQRETEYEIDGFRYPRVPFGEEQRNEWPSGPCHDCAALRPQYHVPGCEVEECPRCHGQAIGCGCGDDGPMAGPES